MFGTTPASPPRSLDDRVASWRRDHPDAEVIADFTGGTMAMSAGPALEASASWRPAGQGIGNTGRIPPAPTVPP